MYCSIVQQTSKSVEFFFKHFPILEGKTYSEARYALLVKPSVNTALTTIAVFHGDRKVVLGLS